MNVVEKIQNCDVDKEIRGTNSQYWDYTGHIYVWCLQQW